MIWHQGFRIGNQESDGYSLLGESGSERRSKRLRECVLGFGDEICIYHRDGEFCDHAIEIGLHILKVRPVESRQPRLHCKWSLQSMAGLAFTRHTSFRDVGGPCRLHPKECKRDLLAKVAQASFEVFSPEAGFQLEFSLESVLLLIAGFVVQKKEWSSFFCHLVSSSIVLSETTLQIIRISNVQLFVLEASQNINIKHTVLLQVRIALFILLLASRLPMSERLS